jgi:cytochrome P450
MSIMADARRRILGLIVPLYVRWRRRNGGALELADLLPDAALLPLQRIGIDPVAELGELRDREPVTMLPAPYGIRAWLVSGYEECKAVLGAAEAFSNDFTHLTGPLGLTAEQNPGGLGFADPPDHTRLRRFLTPEFTVRRLRRLAPRIAAIVEGQLDVMADVAARGGRPDLARDFALPIPSLAICELLGIRYEDRGDFERLSTARFDLLGGFNGSFGAMSESIGYLMDVVAKERAEPGDGLLGMLVREHGDEIDDRELAGIADGLLTGGLETTTSMLALGGLVVMRDERLRRSLLEDDSAPDRLVEELLRLITPVQVAFPRFARTEIELGGRTILPGDIVVCSLSAADRDRALGPDVDTVDLQRKSSPHLAFGYGIHRCVGAELARMELRTAYPALLRRFPAIRPAIPELDIPYRKLSFVYGVDALPVTLD